MGFQPFAGNRFFCGRFHRRPLYIVLLDRLGYHQEFVRVAGTHEIRKEWRREPTRVRSVYTCRKRMDHWRVTVKPAGTRWVTMIHDRDFSEYWKDLADSTGVRKRNTPYWKERIAQRTREEGKIQVPTDAWEIGHRYEYTRWEPLR